MDTHILAVDDDLQFLTFLKAGLEPSGWLLTAPSLKEAYSLLEKNGIDTLLLDIGLGEENGLKALKTIKGKYPDLDIIMVSGYKDPQLIVEAIRTGAADYLVKPFDIEDLTAILEKLRPIRSIRERHAAFVAGTNSMTRPIIGESPSFKAVLGKARQLKGHQVPVLIEGESGTGKELLARYIHGLENNPQRPFVAVNCAAIPDNLLESELFGHEKGAFTGAEHRKIGKFELAHEGDIFLDEISCMKLELQTKLLRVLQEREIQRVGGNQPIQADFRVIASTNDNLENMVRDGKFRHDLYHRLKVISLALPPLRERTEDLPTLVEYFLKKHDPKGGRHINQSAVDVFKNYRWPGNVRELENLVQSLLILIPEREIKEEHLPEWVFKSMGTEETGESAFWLPLDRSQMKPLREYIEKAEKAYIGKALEFSKGDKTAAATLLDISRTRLYDRLKDWEGSE